MGLVTWRGCVSVGQVLTLAANATDDAQVYQEIARELEARAHVDANLLDGRLRWVEACGALLGVQVLLGSLALI